MDLAVAQLALIFLPGIIWANLDRVYGTGVKSTAWEVTLKSFLFGIATYAVLYLIYSISGHEFSSTAINGDGGPHLKDFTDEIVWSVPLSLILAVLWLYMVKFRLVMKSLHKICATNRFGAEDVWSFTFNSTQAHVEYIHLRDIEQGFVFAGWVNAYSEDEEIREILLRDAIIYDENGSVISEAPHLYISRKRDNMWVEFPYSEKS